MKSFSIYGDNIVECERMLSLIRKALNVRACRLSGSVMAPIFSLDTDHGEYLFNFYPGFGRWDHDVVAAIRQSGGILRETPDVFITAEDGNQERVVLAVEFCSALPAGNQAWQRSGRAYSVARAGIPYLFVTELGGFELDAMRNKKAPRLPNPAVPFSFISYSENADSDVMIAYQMNPGADSENRDKYARMIAEADLPRYIVARLDGVDASPFAYSMERKAFSFVLSTASEKKVRVAALNSDDWKRVNDSMQRDGNASELYKAFDIPWKKKISVPTKISFKKFLGGIERIATALVSGDLPFCIVRSEKSAKLIEIVKSAYPRLADSLPAGELANRDIALCFINGFKPRGDDARPDRGLLPFLRMLVGDSIKVLTIVYGPATKAMTDKLSKSPEELGEENGLWEAILSLSDYVICDSMRSSAPILQKGWASERLRVSRAESVLMPANTSHCPRPSSEGENDVDSAIHILFAYALDGKCFESMCNPPGGDWSGMSLMFNGREYRWLTLPRVSSSGSKRPDHVIQAEPDAILAIESKDTLRNLERKIGPRLNRYCADLFRFKPSCVRTPDGGWNDDVNGFTLPDMKYVSACAFMVRSESDMDGALAQTRTDIAFAISFDGEQTTVRICFSKNCEPTVKKLLCSVSVPDGLNMRVVLQ